MTPYTEYEESQNRQTPKSIRITTLLSKPHTCKHCKHVGIDFVHRTDLRSPNADALFFRCRFCNTPRKFFV